MDTTTAGRPGTGQVDGTRFDTDWWRMRTPLIVIAGLAIAGFSLVLASTNEIGHAAAWGLAATAVLLGARHRRQMLHQGGDESQGGRCRAAGRSGRGHERGWHGERRDKGWGWGWGWG